MLFIGADKVFNGRQFMPEGTVIALNGDLSFKEFVDKNAVDKSNVKYYKGILTPGFVNAHCHLELSHLKGQIPQHTGLPRFATEVIKQRSSKSAEETENSMLAADLEMRDNGIVAVGDISNNALSREAKQRSKLYYHTFVELIGLSPNRSAAIFSAGLEVVNQFRGAGLPVSIAPHAPYSTSRELMTRIAEYGWSDQLPFCIHNQESQEETRFFFGQKNGFNDLYDFLKVDISWFCAPGTSSLKYYGALLPAGRSMLVHNTFTEKKDLDFVSPKNIYWCFCPGANLYIENRLPEFSLFKSLADTLCLGTDSLASNSQLNLIAEANLVRGSKVFSEEEVLSMLTLNGAKALGIDQSFGQFVPGKNSGLNLVDHKGPELSFIQKIA